MMTNLPKAGATLLIVGMLLIALASDGGQSALQRIKYGRPVSFCLDDARATLKGDWQISLLQPSRGSWPLIGGVLPIPTSNRLDDDTLAQASLKSSTHAGEISVSLLREVADGKKLMNDCKASNYCEPAISQSDSESKVIRISNSDTVWIRYIDRPIMVGLHGVTDGVDTVVIGVCDRPR